MSLSPEELQAIIPQDKHDHERMALVIAAGYPAVEPILWELLEWIQDMNWPVARTMAPFLQGIGKPLIPHIERVFRTDDGIWKSWIMTEILEHDPEMAAHFRETITDIAYGPTHDEDTEAYAEYARDFLAHFGWLDPDREPLQSSNNV